MKVAFLVLAHTDYSQLYKLCTRLSPNKFFDTKIYIHIDKKCKMPEEQFPDYVNFISRRHYVTRCGISQVESELELMKAAFSDDVFDRYVLITGQDYPVASNEEIADFLSQNKEYIRTHLVSGTEMEKKVTKFYFYNRFTSGNALKVLFRRTLQVLTSPFRKGNTVKFGGGYSWNIYYGSAYFAVTQEMIEYMISVSSDTRFHRYFRYSITSDELYFSTIAANSPYKDRLDDSNTSSSVLVDNSAITFFDYNDRPKVYDEKDYEYICNSRNGRIFARKFESGISDKLIEKLESDI